MTEYANGLERRQAVLDWFVNQDKTEIVADYMEMVVDKLVAVGREDVRQAFDAKAYSTHHQPLLATVTPEQQALIENVELAAEAEFMTTLIDVLTTRTRDFMLHRVRSGTGI